MTIIINQKLYYNLTKIISYCPLNKNIIKKFYNEKDIKTLYIRWDYIFKKIMKLYKYDNENHNNNIEKNLIYLLNIISKDEESKKHVINLYIKIRNEEKYRFILNDMPDLQIRLLFLVKENSLLEL